MRKQHEALQHWNPGYWTISLFTTYVEFTCCEIHHHILGQFVTGSGGWCSPRNYIIPGLLELLWHARNVWYCIWQDWVSLIHHHHHSLDIVPSEMKLVSKDQSLYLITRCYTQHIWTLKDEVNSHLQCSQHGCVCEIPVYIAQTLLDNGQSYLVCRQDLSLEVLLWIICSRLLVLQSTQQNKMQCH